MRLAVLALTVTSCSIITSLTDLGGPDAAADGGQDAADAAAADVGTSYTAVVLADQPIAFFPFDDQLGTIAPVDLVDGGLSAKCSNVTFGAAGVRTDASTAAYFGGSAAFAWCSVGMTDQLDFEQDGGFAPFTLEAWVVPDDAGTGNLVGRIFSNENNPGNNQQDAAVDAGWQGYFVVVPSGNGNTSFTRETTGQSCGPFAATNPLTRYHVVASFDGSFARLWLNGTLFPIQCFKPLLEHGNTLGVGGFDGFFQGRMSDIAVYDTALSAARVGCHYAAGLALDASAVATACTGP